MNKGLRVRGSEPYVPVCGTLLQPHVHVDLDFHPEAQAYTHLPPSC